MNFRGGLTLLLVTAFALAVVGCGGDQAEQTQVADTEEAGNNQAETNGETASGGGNSPGSGTQDRTQDGTDEAGNQASQDPEEIYDVITADEVDVQVMGDAEACLSMESYFPTSVAADQYAEGAQYDENGETIEQNGGICEEPAPVPVLPEGIEDESDGPLKDYRVVAYYGHPWVFEMGILGEYEPEELVTLLKEQAAEYAAADPSTPVIPAIELIASVAQRDPGPDGTYVAQTPAETIEEYADLAEKHGLLLMLDVQLGTMEVEDEIEILRPFLERPYVHLAIDTEYSIGPGEVPGIDLGQVDGSEMQAGVEMVDQIVEENDLPDKIVMVHQFEDIIVQNKQLIEPTDNVQVALHADGFGGPAAKISKYNILVRDAPIQYGGFKVFYRQDAPVLSAAEVLQLDPAPAVITYQ